MHVTIYCRPGAGDLGFHSAREISALEDRVITLKSKDFLVLMDYLMIDPSVLVYNTTWGFVRPQLN